MAAARGDAAIQRFSHDVRRLFGGRFFYALIFGLSKKKKGYARTKTYKMDRNNAPAAGHPVLHYRITVNPKKMRKTSSFLAAFLLLLTIGRPDTLQAQFFKNLVNTVKQTAQGRANSKADQTTNRSLDKVDTTSSSLFGGGSRSGSTNPSDTSAAQRRERDVLSI
jgi:hypothetical protein